MSWLGLKTRVLAESAGFSRTVPQADRVHVAAAMEWLKRAQDAMPDQGVAQTYFMREKRWARSYPETTGYIIPTFYSYGHVTGDADARTRARRMAQWECEIQLPDGGVVAGALGDSDQPTVFNTGQVLFGWVRAFEEEGDDRYLEASFRAGNWLCDIQDADGCWRKFGSPMTTRNVNLYNTRTAWGLTRVAAATGEQRFHQAAVKNVEWALSQQHENGWLPHNCLQDDAQPFVHTIAYALRGFLEVGVCAGREDFLVAAMKIADALADKVPKSGHQAGRFNAAWSPTVRWSCLTGNAQMAINWYRLYELTGKERYRSAARAVMRFVQSTQRLTGTPEERGGIKGSHPINGGYHPWQYPNWAAKFFVDACLTGERLESGGKSTGAQFKNDG